jgi:hypothetical protein
MPKAVTLQMIEWECQVAPLIWRHDACPVERKQLAQFWGDLNQVGCYAALVERRLGLGTGFRWGVGKSPKMPQNPASQVHALLGGVFVQRVSLL